MAEPLQAPFPYWGGKRRSAPEVWRRFGEVTTYIEPFAGSLATLLASPYGPASREIVNDLDGFVSNFWRALRADPELVAYFADWPTSHLDLTARKQFCVDRLRSLTAELRADMDFYDPEIAGYWVWCVSNDIGLFREGSAIPDDEKLPVALPVSQNRPHVHSNRGGLGVSAQVLSSDRVIQNRPHVTAPSGVSAQSVNRRPVMSHHGGGVGVQAQVTGGMPHLAMGAGGQGIQAQVTGGMPHVDREQYGRGVQAQVTDPVVDRRPVTINAGGMGVQAQSKSATDSIPVMGNKGVQAGRQDEVIDRIPQVYTSDSGRGVMAQRHGEADSVYDRRPKVNSDESGNGVQAQSVTHRIPVVPSNKGVMADKVSDRIPHATGAQGVQNQREGFNSRPGISRVGISNVDLPEDLTLAEALAAVLPCNGRRLFRQFTTLAERLWRVYILCKDWSTLCSPSVMGLTPSDLKAKTPPVCGIYLDPPYQTPGRKDNLYRVDSVTVAEDVRRWAIEKGADPNIRIALAGYAGDYREMPDGWTEYVWSTGQNRMGKVGGAEYDRTEVLLFSPHCLTGKEGKEQGRLEL